MIKGLPCYGGPFSGERLILESPNTLVFSVGGERGMYAAAAWFYRGLPRPRQLVTIDPLQTQVEALKWVPVNG